MNSNLGPTLALPPPPVAVASPTPLPRMPHFVFIARAMHRPPRPSESLADAWRRAIQSYFPPGGRLGPGEAYITVREGSLEELDPAEVRNDCIVSPANSFGIMDGGFDLELSRIFQGRSPDAYALTDHVQAALRARWAGFAPAGSCTLVPLPAEVSGTGLGGGGNRWGTHTLAVLPTMKRPEGVGWNRELVYNGMWALLCEIGRWNGSVDTDSGSGGDAGSDVKRGEHGEPDGHEGGAWPSRSRRSCGICGRAKGVRCRLSLSGDLYAAMHRSSLARSSMTRRRFLVSARGFEPGPGLLGSAWLSTQSPTPAELDVWPAAFLAPALSDAYARYLLLYSYSCCLICSLRESDRSPLPSRSMVSRAVLLFDFRLTLARTTFEHHPQPKNNLAPAAGRSCLTSLSLRVSTSLPRSGPTVASRAGLRRCCVAQGEACKRDVCESVSEGAA